MTLHSMNDLIRGAAAHATQAVATEQRERVGRIGIGVGGAAGVPRVPAEKRPMHAALIPAGGMRGRRSRGVPAVRRAHP
jgi:hypothetical protein